MREKSRCFPSIQQKNIGTLAEAKRQCNDEPSCHMIVHYRLENHNILLLETFSFCGVRAKIGPGYNCLLYTKFG